MKPSLYNHERRLEHAMLRVRCASIPEGSRKAILQFIEYVQACGLSSSRVLKYADVLRIAALELGREFRDATRDDMTRLVAGIEKRPYSEWTKAGYRACVKRFYKWLLGKDEEYPKIVSWIKARVARDRLPLPERSQLVTEDDVRRLLQHASHPRDRAYIALLWDSGARVGEIGTLMIRSVTFDRYGARIHVLGKTGARQVRTILASPYLANWLQQHPHGSNPEAPLWVSTSNLNRGQPLRYSALRKILYVTFQRAGISKRSNPHSFRHARATHLASHLTEFQMNTHFGWVQGSGMPSTYVHLSGKDTDSALLRLHGVQEDQAPSRPALQPRACGRCDTINAHDASFCRKCGLPLEMSAALAVDSETRSAERLMADVMKDDDVKKAVQVALVKLRLRQPFTQVNVAPLMKDAGS